MKGKGMKGMNATKVKMSKTKTVAFGTGTGSVKAGKTMGNQGLANKSGAKAIGRI